MRKNRLRTQQNKKTFCDSNRTKRFEIRLTYFFQNTDLIILVGIKGLVLILLECVRVLTVIIVVVC